MNKYIAQFSPVDIESTFQNISRHVLTSGHCICDHSEDPKKIKIPAKCIPGENENQITHMNRIIVHGGSRSSDPENPRWKPEDIFQIEEAVIMETQPRTIWAESIDKACTLHLNGERCNSILWNRCSWHCTRDGAAALAGVFGRHHHHSSTSLSAYISTS